MLIKAKKLVTTSFIHFSLCRLFLKLTKTDADNNFLKIIWLCPWRLSNHMRIQLTEWLKFQHWMKWNDIIEWRTDSSYFFIVELMFIFFFISLTCTNEIDCFSGSKWRYGFVDCRSTFKLYTTKSTVEIIFETNTLKQFQKLFCIFCTV